ncbi:MAG: GtrA family protein [Candidatus Saccharimonas sp.]|nr:MAG: GtrA family protein [Candidatus Saccharimonas sp.]
MQEVVKKHADKLRFAIVGSVNTTLDFSILFILTMLFNISKELANFISTSVSFLFSFFANKKYTFKSTSKNLKRQFILFTIVTLFGLWVIQTIIIAAITPVFTNLGINKPAALLISKLIATAASLIWNYTLYSRVVFKKPKNSSD